MNRLKNSLVLRAAVNAVIIVMLLLAVVMNLSVFTPYQTLAVVSGSMSPTIPKGSIVIIKPQENYQPGDVVTFRSSTEPVIRFTHRIVDIDENGLAETRGDANPSSDPERSSLTRAEGKVVLHVPVIGYPVMALDHTWVKAVVFGFLLFWILLEMEFARQRRRARKASLDEQQREQQAEGWEEE